MMIKFRNFRRLTDAGPLGSCLDGILTLSVIMLVLAALAFQFRDSLGLLLLLALPAAACLFAIASELWGHLSAKQDDSAD